VQRTGHEASNYAVSFSHLLHRHI